MQFCSTPSSGSRQSPISRSTEIQFKPLITTELGSLPLFPLSAFLFFPLSSYHFLQPPYRNRSYLPPAPFTSRLVPISVTIPPRAHGMAVYFSNLKSYLLISYVSPPRLGIFTEAIVSPSGSHCSYARAPRDTDSIWFIFSLSPSPSSPLLLAFCLTPFGTRLFSIALDATREGNCVERTALPS